jgi:hypothetical protein
MKRPFFERLREKPKEVRVQASFLMALGVTGMIGLLWGVTLPTRLQGFPKGDNEADQTAQVEAQNSFMSFFADTKNNLGQLIGAAREATTTEAQQKVTDSAPKSDAYQVGAPADGVEYNKNYPLEKQAPGVTPVDRREVRIGTTTSPTKGQ